MSEKRGAVELSVSTIVVVVIAISMLILGLVLVNKIMCGAINGIGIIDDAMKKKMNALFTSGRNVVIKEQENYIYKNVKGGYGVAFAIRNDGKTSPDFSYEVKLSDIGNCKVSESQAEDFIIVGRKGKTVIKSGDEYLDLIKFKIPQNVAPCELKYVLLVKNDGEPYASEPINVVIREKPFSKSFCGGS